MVKRVLSLALVVAAFLLAARQCAHAGESPIAFMLAQAADDAQGGAPARGGHERGGSGSSLVDEAALRIGVPVAIARAVLRVESGGNCRARSASGALGAMQVLPATARAMGVYGPLTSCANSIEAGLRYLKRIIDAHGSGCAALALYNRGERAAPVCTSYGRAVLAFAGRTSL